jgi:hypothetical protein
MKAPRDAVERAIRNLVVARDIGPIYAKWFESRLPNGERFNIPMSRSSSNPSPSWEPPARRIEGTRRREALSVQFESDSVSRLSHSANTYTIEHALAYLSSAGLTPSQCGPTATAMYCLPLTA